MAAHRNRRDRLSFLAAAGLLTVSLIGFANVYSYSNADSFLGLALTAQGAHTLQVMVSYAVDAAAVIICGLLVLMCQSLPTVSSFKLSTQWWLVVTGQALAVLTSVTSVLWPTFEIITTSRALHGVGEALYMIYSLVLLVELSPRKHLALGIASLTAGMTAGDSVGPVVGAVMYDATGLRGAFTLQAAINGFALLMSLLMIPLWLFAPSTSKEQLLQAHTDCATLPTIGQQCPQITTNTSSSSSSSSSSSGGTGSTKSPATSKPAHQGHAKDTLNSDQDRNPVLLIYNNSISSNSSVTADIKQHHKPPLGGCDTDLQHARATAAVDGQQEQLPKLDLAAVVATVKDPAIFSQCLLLLLEQAIRNSLTVVLPVAMGTRQLVVGMVYLANVVGSVTSPFFLDAYLARRGSRCATHRLSAWTCLIMGAACAAVIPLGRVVPALVVILLVAGSTQACIEALTYIHIAKRLDQLQRSSAVHVSMAMYILAQTMGSGFGSLIGSAVLQQPWVVQIAALAAVCGVAGLYGVVLGVWKHKGWCCKGTALEPISGNGPHCGGAVCVVQQATAACCSNSTGNRARPG